MFKCRDYSPTPPGKILTIDEQIVETERIITKLIKIIEKYQIEIFKIKNTNIDIKLTEDTKKIFRSIGLMLDQNTYTDIEILKKSYMYSFDTDTPEIKIDL